MLLIAQERPRWLSRPERNRRTMSCCVLWRDPVSDPRRASLIEVELVLLQVRAQMELGWVVAKFPRLAAAGWGLLGQACTDHHSRGAQSAVTAATPASPHWHVPKYLGGYSPYQWTAAPSQLQQLESGNDTTSVTRKAHLLPSRCLQHARPKKCREHTYCCAPFPCDPWISPNSSSTPNSPNLNTIAWEIPSVPGLVGRSDLFIFVQTPGLNFVVFRKTVCGRQRKCHMTARLVRSVIHQFPTFSSQPSPAVLCEPNT